MKICVNKGLGDRAGPYITLTEENAVKVLKVINFCEEEKVCESKGLLRECKISFTEKFFKTSFSWFLVERCLCSGYPLKSVDSYTGIKTKPFIAGCSFCANKSIVQKDKEALFTLTISTIAAKTLFLCCHFNQS